MPRNIVMGGGDDPRIIKKIQELLNKELGGVLTLDGVFGPNTKEAVEHYQQDHHLTTDGIIGPLTLAKMFPGPAYVAPERHKVELFTQKEKVERANMCIGAPISYHLEYPNGGTDPEASTPADEHTHQLDCAGFVAWCQGYDRDFLEGMSDELDKWGGYANTDSTIAAAERDGDIFTIVPVAEAQAGDIIVSESYRTLLGRKVIGHTGVIVGVGNTGRDGLAGLQVVHCSPSNVPKNESKSAVWKTSATIWKNYKKVLIVRFNSERAYKRYLSLVK